MSGLSEIKKLLTNRIGLDPISVGSAQIGRAVQQRMKDLGQLDIDTYKCLVSQSDGELQELIEEVVVPESWFFRDERPFQFFRDHVACGWLGDPLRAALRVLSLPCASGEEPYSIAMALRRPWRAGEEISDSCR